MLVCAQRDADRVKFEALRAQFCHVVSQRDNINEEPVFLRSQHNNTRKELVSVMALLEKLEVRRDASTHQNRRDVPEVEACRKEHDDAKDDIAGTVKERNRLEKERNVPEEIWICYSIKSTFQKRRKSFDIVHVHRGSTRSFLSSLLF